MIQSSQFLEKEQTWLGWVYPLQSISWGTNNYLLVAWIWAGCLSSPPWPQCSHTQNGSNKSPFLLASLWQLNDIIYAVWLAQCLAQTQRMVDVVIAITIIIQSRPCTLLDSNVLVHFCQIHSWGHPQIFTFISCAGCLGENSFKGKLELGTAIVNCLRNKALAK